MRIRIALLLIVSVGFLTSPSHARTFTVDVAADDAHANDVNPGDGVCLDAFDSCTLRAAIQESNAYAGTDTISFIDSFNNSTIIISASEGPLPPITDRVNILGKDIANYNMSATLLRNAPPQIFIDGRNLTAGGNNGLLFSGTAAAGSIISAIGIVAFPGSGIVAGPGADNLIIERNYIGVRADGSAAGNGTHGVYAAGTDGHRIGKAEHASEPIFSSLGNVLSSNGQSGIRLESSDNNSLRGNLIGIAPAGTGDRGNGAYGIQIGGTSNYIGAFSNSSNVSAGNFIAGNDQGGIFSIGDNNHFYANSLGIGETGSFIDSEADGIVAIGSSNHIGADGRGRNRIVEHILGSAIRLGNKDGTAANENFVVNNQTGSAGAQFPLLFSQNGVGIYVANGDGNVISNNAVINSRFRQGYDTNGDLVILVSGNGIEVLGDSNAIHSNQVGFVNSITGPRAEPNSAGIVVKGDYNIIGNELNPNQIGGNFGGGVSVSGDNNTVGFNYIGVTSNFADVGNGSTGLFINGGTSNRVESNVIGNNTIGLQLFEVFYSSYIVRNFIGITPAGDNIGNGSQGVRVIDSKKIEIQRNHISYNAGGGITTYGTAEGVAWHQNLMHGNTGMGVDINRDDRTFNDPADIDEGPNRLQNFPVIENAVLDSSTTPRTLTISYRVDTSSDSAEHPLYVDFYWSDINEDLQGRFYLGIDTYHEAPNGLRTRIFNFVDGVSGGWLTATAMDQDINTSELADRFQFGSPSDVLFADGFE